MLDVSNGYCYRAVLPEEIFETDLCHYLIKGCILSCGVARQLVHERIIDNFIYCL